jgi:hypothetical protein
MKRKLHYRGNHSINVCETRKMGSRTVRPILRLLWLVCRTGKQK